MNPAKWLLPLPVLAAGAVAVTGCGTTKSNAEPPKTTDNAAPAATTTTAAAPATPTAGPVSVKLSEFKIDASSSVVKAGKVTFDATNTGKIPHEMVVLKTAKQAANLGPSGTSRVSETGHVGEVGDLKPGASGKVTLKLKPGHYVLVCNLPGHWASGMRTDLTVQ